MTSQIQLPKYVLDFMAEFTRAGYEIYVVGGAVRDLLLQSETSKVMNWDFATNATPEQIQKLFPDSFYHNEYGTVSVPINIDSHFHGNDKKMVFEITPFRKESDYTDNRHPEKIIWAKTIEEDLLRRDFTINAIALSEQSESKGYDHERSRVHRGRVEGPKLKIIDITNGISDIEKKLIRAVGDPDQRFSEDGLRLLRAIRFASELGFMIEEKTLSSIKKNFPLIKNISGERIRDEFLKILASAHPAEGILFLKSTGLLKIILPELDQCFAIEQKSPKRHHIYDVGTHSVEALRYCISPDPITRFASLIHDIGKAETYNKDPETKLITFFNHEHASAKLAKNIAERFKLSKEQKNKLITLVRFHMFSVTEKQTDKALRRFIRNVGIENLDEILSLRLGDRIGSGAKPTSWRTELFKKRLVEVQKIPFQIKDLKIDGNDVMKILKIKPGPQVGKILQKIFDEVEDGKIKNEREELLNIINKYKLNY